MTDDEIAGDDPSSRQIEWDENKRRVTLEKHGLDFLDAADVFDDPRRVVFRSKHPPDETRYITLGMLNGRLVAVIWTVRAQRLRLISMRPARRNERKRYEEAS